MATKTKTTIRFDTSAFRLEHDAEPRGFGSWAFGLEREPASDAILWAPAPRTLTDAKRAVAAQLKQRFPNAGTLVVFVLP